MDYSVHCRLLAISFQYDFLTFFPSFSKVIFYSPHLYSLLLISLLIHCNEYSFKFNHHQLCMEHASCTARNSLLRLICSLQETQTVSLFYFSKYEVFRNFKPSLLLISRVVLLKILLVGFVLLYQPQWVI